MLCLPLPTDTLAGASSKVTESFVFFYPYTDTFHLVRGLEAPQRVPV